MYCREQVIGSFIMSNSNRLVKMVLLVACNESARKRRNDPRVVLCLHFFNSSTSFVYRLVRLPAHPSSDTDMSSNTPASGSSRKRPASEGFDTRKTLGTFTKKRNTESTNACALDPRTKPWKGGLKCSSDGSTDPDGSKNSFLRATHPDVPKKLENPDRVHTGNSPQ